MGVEEAFLPVRVPVDWLELLREAEWLAHLRVAGTDK